MKIRKQCTRVIVSVLCFYGVPSVEAQSTEKPSPFQDLLASIEALRVRENISAVGIALVEGEHAYAGGLGTLSHTSKRPVTHDTIFRIGSITKSFTSLAVLKLVENEQIKLNDPIALWVPKDLYRNPWEERHPINVAHLLEHTAGFQDLSKEEFDYNDPRPRSLSDTLNRYKDHHVSAWQPGLHSSYSNLGAAYAGYIIEQASGKRYEDYVHQAIFKTLDMKHSSFFVDHNKEREFSVGYDTDGTTPMSYYWHMVYRPFGGINTSSDDMKRFLRVLIDRGAFNNQQVFKADSITRMEQPTTTFASTKGLNYGYGLGNYQWLRDGILFHGHGGDAHGYLSRYGYTRTNNSGYFVVITAFNHGALRKIRRLIEQYLIKDLAPPASPKQHKLNETTVAHIVGEYKEATSRFGRADTVMQISFNGGRLFTKINNRNTSELIPVSETTFRRKGQTLATIVIASDPSGNVLYQDDNRNFIKHIVTKP